jgi:hypothetical protein
MTKDVDLKKLYQLFEDYFNKYLKYLFWTSSCIINQVIILQHNTKFIYIINLYFYYQLVI